MSTHLFFRFLGRLSAILLASLCAPMVIHAVQQIVFKPGSNRFTVEQDVQIGQKNAAQADKQLAPLNRPEYVWRFKVVNTRDINAFALPGGFIYVNRGTIEAAENEAELAGVMAHEEGHVVMRHGTHQATEAMKTQAIFGILGTAAGQLGGIVGLLGQEGAAFGSQSVLLHNSRGSESQADEVGTYILYRAGYNPRAMSDFFEILAKKYPDQTLQFFSDHPNPENRVKKVDALIPQLGAPLPNPRLTSPEFEAVKRRLLALPPSPARAKKQQ